MNEVRGKESISCSLCAKLLDESEIRVGNSDSKKLELIKYFHKEVDWCKDDECSTCGILDCPYGEPFHYSPDGCPTCKEAKKE